MKTKHSRLSSLRREFIRTAGLGATALLNKALAFASGRDEKTHMQEERNGKPRRVIIDTDPGTDDALAIFLALRSPELKVEAITPVAGNVPLSLTLPNALRLVEIAGRTDIPVAAGAEHPLKRRLVTAAYAHGENGLGGVQFPEPKTRPAGESAAAMIDRMVRDAPGEISIIAIGPLTNVALAFRENPQLPRMLKGITLMGGSLSGGNVTPAAEFNMYVDPEAAQTVFRSGVPITMVGLDATRHVALHEEHISALEKSSDAVAHAAGLITRAVMDHSRKAGYASGPVMHDSLAVATFLDPSLAKLQEYYVEIETAGEFTAGETVGYKRGPIRRSAPFENSPASENISESFRPNCKVALDVDAQRFFDLLIGRLTGMPTARRAGRT